VNSWGWALVANRNLLGSAQERSRTLPQPGKTDSRDDEGGKELQRLFINQLLEKGAQIGE